MYEGIPSGKQKKLDKKSWAPKHKAVFGEESRMIHESVFGEKGNEVPKSDKELVDAARRVNGTDPAPIHESVFGKEERVAAPIHESVLGKTGEKEVDAEIDASIEEVVDSERSEVKTKDPESLEHWPNNEPKVAQEEQDATELAAVRERLGIAPQDKEQKKVNLEYNLHKDEDYVQIRDGIYARNREKHPNLIEVEAEREFQRRFPQKFAEHEAAEAERIYADTQGRPFLRNDPMYQRMFIRQEHGGGGRNDNLHYEVNAAQFDFIDRYPVKAAAYATTDEGIAYKLKLRKEQYERDRQRRAAA